MGLKKIKNIKKYNLKWKKETLEGIFYINFNKLTDKQKKMLHELYLEYVNNGKKSKEALDKAYQIVTCFKL